MISDVTAGDMEEAFWIMWKALVPVLAIIIVALLSARREKQRRADSLEQELANSNQKRSNLVRKLAEAQIQANEAQALANILRHRDEATCPCSAVKALQDRNTYLEDRNNQLVFDALNNNAGKYIKINRN